MLVESNAKRLSRRITKKGSVTKNEIELIAQAFGLTSSHVQQWAQQQVMPLEAEGLAASLIQLGMNQ
jgi:hypothetical protein